MTAPATAKPRRLPITLKLRDDLLMRLRLNAVAEGSTIGRIVEDLIADHLRDLVLTEKKGERGGGS